jgi:flagellar basal-body rod modification protein FlgD
MAVTGVTGNLGTTASPGVIDNPTATMGKTDFLQMLITKLKYQDPTNPVTDDSFVADMAQFSSLEQMQNMNTSVASQSEAMQNLNTNIIALIMMQNTTQAAGLIGKTVALTNPTTGGADITGTVSVVKFVDGQPKIVVNGVEYGLASIKEIRA